MASEPLKRSHRLLLIAIALGFAVLTLLVGAMVVELEMIRQLLNEIIRP